MHVTSTEVHLVVSLAVAATAAGEKLDRISGNDRLIRVVTGRDLCKNDTNKAVIDRRLRPGVATWEVTLSARKVVPCVRWPATRITAHSL